MPRSFSKQALLKLKKTSLKIFKHYKLKPSFSIIKDEKAKDKVGVGEKSPSFKFWDTSDSFFFSFLE